jgi:hypothetical protein
MSSSSAALLGEGNNPKGATKDAAAADVFVKKSRRDGCNTLSSPDFFAPNC